MEKQLPSYFPNLTPLRGVAALAVILFHKITIYSGVNPEVGGLDKLIDGIFNKGSLGVNFFFTLSGFLITYLLIREIKKTGGFNAWNFIVRRILRIWPVYFIVTGFGFLLYPILADVSINHDPLYFVSFLSNFDEIINGLNGSVHSLTVLWSVSIEEQFYIVWAIILGIVSLNPKKHYPIFFILVIIASIVFRFMHLDNERMLYYHTLSVISDMSLGGLLAHQFIFTNRIEQIILRISKVGHVIIYGIGIGFILLHNKLMVGELYAVDRLITGMFWCYIIAEQIIADKSFVKYKNFKWLDYLGRISYGLYAYHLIVFFFINEYFVEAGYWRENTWLDLGLNTIIILAATTALSTISYYVIERPLLSFKDRFRKS